MSYKRVMGIIDNMAEYIEVAKPSPFSRDTIKVSREAMFNFIDSLRQVLPIELKEAGKILNSRKDIITDAQRKAEQLEIDTEEKIRTLISQEEITVRANEEADLIIDDAEKRAEEIISEANSVATQIKMGALSYTEDKLSELERLVAASIEKTTKTSNNLLTALGSNLDIIRENKNEITSQLSVTNGEEDTAEAQETVEDEETNIASQIDYTVDISDEFNDEE